MKFKYYLISGIDPARKPFMLDQFQRYSVPLEDVTWLCHPNKNEFTHEMARSYFTNQSLGGPEEYIHGNLGLGQLSCTLKHYFALKDIVEHQYSYGVIMEDNVAFHSNLPVRLEQYLQQLPADWDVLFDTDWLSYKDVHEDPVTEGQLVYKKNNAVSQYCHGSSRIANFLMVSLKGATLLYENFLPFNHVSDWNYNNMFRRLDMKVYWAEPGNTTHVKRPSTW